MKDRPFPCDQDPEAWMRRVLCRAEYLPVQEHGVPSGFHIELPLSTVNQKFDDKWFIGSAPHPEEKDQEGGHSHDGQNRGNNLDAPQRGGGVGQSSCFTRLPAMCRGAP